jgi:hypothetical protein
MAMDGHDFTTCLRTVAPPCNLALYVPGPSTVTLGGFTVPGKAAGVGSLKAMTFNA